MYIYITYGIYKILENYSKMIKETPIISHTNRKLQG